jgi:hypothetical protein
MLLTITSLLKIFNSNWSVDAELSRAEGYRSSTATATDLTTERSVIYV